MTFEQELAAKDQQYQEREFPIVGIGASAGGLESLESLFKAMPAESGMAFVVVQHLSPDFKSMMDTILARRTNIPVRQVEDKLKVVPDTVYLMPAGKEMVLSQGRLLLTDRPDTATLSLPIDHFFRSLAQDAGPRAIGIILSGTGSDGARGVTEIQQAGGLVLCESESSARFTGMPLSAKQSGAVDQELAPEAMPEALIRYCQDRLGLVKTMEPPDPVVENIFSSLQNAYGIDFRHYRSSTIGRRIERRLSLTSAGSLAEYARSLPGNPTELANLYADLLIGVTQFFRNPQAFEMLEQQGIPDILERRADDDDPIRVWVAGCASGEEAYSLAILLREAVEKHQRTHDIKIFATDIDHASLTVAGQGIYEDAALQGVSQARIRRYFKATRGGYRVIPEIRRMVTFAQHDVLKDAPFTNLDLVTCRNLLIYFKPQAQKKAISLFHFGLNTHGLLFLGQSETVGDLADEFEVVDERTKLFKKRRDVRLLSDLKVPLRGRRLADGKPNRAQVKMGGNRHDPLLPLYDNLLDRFMPFGILIDAHRELVDCYGGAESLLRYRARRPSRDVIENLDLETTAPVSGAILRAQKRQKKIALAGLRGKDEAGTRYLLTVFPITHPSTREDYYFLNFQKIAEEVGEDTVIPRLNELHHSDDEFDALQSELDYTKESLQSMIQELESSNEELQSTNEELMAANEELQSTNEELNSVNEELFTINNEYQRKIEELKQLNEDMNHLLASTKIGTLFVDRELKIRRFTPGIIPAFQFTSQDVGRPVAAFSHNLALEGLSDKLWAAVNEETAFEQEVKDAEGNALFLRILPYRIDSVVEGAVLTLTNIATLQAARDELAVSEQRYRSLIEQASDAIFIADLDGVYTEVNGPASKLVGYDHDELIGQPMTMLLPDIETERFREYRRQLIESGERDLSEWTLVTKDGSEVQVEISATIVAGQRWQTIARDIGRRKEIERGLAEARAQADAANKAKSAFLANMSHEIRTPMSAILGYTEVLSGHLDDPDDIACVNIIRQNSNHLLEIINDILDLSKIESNQLETMQERFDPSIVVADIYSMFTIPAREKHITLSVDADTPIPRIIRSDPRRLRQILINLVGNAIKFTPSGTVSILLSFNEGAECLRFAVSDSGIGIPEQDIALLFKPFSQLDNSARRAQEGTGLGLAISKQLAERLGGDLTVSSEPGSGSTFTLTIATGADSADELIEPSFTLPGGELDNRNMPELKAEILVVDDRHDIRYLAQRALEIAGARVTTVEDGAAALAAVEQAQRHDAEFDLIVMDMQMPVLDGYSATRELRERGYDKCILALTAAAMKGDREKCLEAGCTDHVSKPFDALKLVNAVARHLSDGSGLNNGAGGNEQPEAAAVSAGHPATILVIDDNRDMRNILQELLSDEGHRVLTAEDAADGLKMAEQHQPDIILSDLRLPDGNGRELIRQLRDGGGFDDTYMVALSGEEISREDALSSGFDDFLLKPPDFDRLLNLMSRSRRHPEAPSS